MADYDVVVIGGGPGGYVCAIRAAQNGLKVACIEGRGALGGTCLNVGCIPSKALLHASEMLHEAEGNFRKMGIKASGLEVDVPQMIAYKQEAIDVNTKGIEFLFKKNKVTYVKGWAEIVAPGQVKVGDEVLNAKNIVIATGSEPAALKGVEVDEKRVVTSTGALELTSVPKKLVVIGAGVIGLELGSVWGRLGAEVTVVEYLDQITPGQDGEVVKHFQRILGKQGFKFVLGAAVQGVETLKTKLKVTYRLRKDDSEQTIDADVVLVATGRKPYTAGLGLDRLGVEMTDKGQIKTDGHWRTNIPGIYAIGDVIEGPMLAHKAEDEGMAAADVIAGRHGHVNYGVIPGVIYTAPEVASVGKTEEQLKAEGRKYKVGKFPFLANGRAKANLVSDGFVKILADAETDRVLGAHIIGPGAGDLIHEICVAMEFGAAAEDIAMTCHAHPTYSEAVREAALACGQGAIHA
ncbi:dihydrolipoyl dehydrogenase [Limibaculum sp. FT325]|uniref:dihydrolipoyl dehydrogenase n=1 Tax=Thermohalobaculum sediminis TaxID=2939436 RepID=UPI0020C0E82D|nr:dihydrolipoyl dehydrogenase [Limibaculum sediminis]MCL5777021.1 dihydrolipoyl dehydrogenase [Limibaculum sediminis]